MFITPDTQPPAPASPSGRRGLMVGWIVALLIVGGLIIWLRQRGSSDMAPLVTRSTDTAQPSSPPKVAPEALPAPEFPKDTDGDGVSDATEAQKGTNPQKADTDGDGFTDGEELFSKKTNPLTPDPRAPHPIPAAPADPQAANP